MMDVQESAWLNRAFTTGLVSVMIPTYNRAVLLLETLSSIWEQTYRPLEVIIIDDGSNDGTADAVAQWKVGKESLDFVVTYHWQENRGLAAARNAGLRLSHGEYLQLIDSDDLIHRSKIEVSVKELEKSGADVVVTKAMQWHDSAEICNIIAGPAELEEPPDPSRRPYYIMRPFWGASGPLFRRSIVVDAGPFPEHARIDEEIEFHARIKCVTNRIRYLGYMMNYYRQSRSNPLSGRGHTLTRCNTAELLEQTLSRYGVTAATEWRQLCDYALRSAYRASLLGERKAFEKSISVARRAARRGHQFARLGMVFMPNSALFLLMGAVGRLRNGGRGS